MTGVIKNLWLRQLRSNQHGGVLIMVGLGLSLLIVASGMGYDLGRQQLVRVKLQHAADSAALAGAALEYGSTSSQRQAEASRYFNLNFPETYLGSPRPTPTISAANGSVQVSATFDVPTSFMKVAGVSTMATQGRSKVQNYQPASTIDMMLVMDNSGSMDTKDAGPRKTRMKALKETTIKVADDLLNPNPLNHRIAIIRWDDNLIASQSFSNNFATTEKRLKAMASVGGTDSSRGTKEAVERKGEFHKNVVPIVVLLTDGENNNFPNKPKNNTTTRILSNAKTLQHCNTLKNSAPHAQIFTVIFGGGVKKANGSPNIVANRAIADFLSECATGDHNFDDATGKHKNEGQFFFKATNQAELNAAFAAIIGVAKKVRIQE